ncbi:MAG: carboxypeptidase regulatory-like domain-containing protein [Thermoplasmata archaeon]|nr:carboxypeptidase regulatory-like domain-containing protein [Thermoplasmata archaeon]
MNLIKLYTSIIVLMMCMMPVAGMTFDENETDNIVEPDVPMTSTIVYGWMNLSGVTPMPNSQVYFQEYMNNEPTGISYSNATNATGFYSLDMNITGGGKIFMVYGINNTCLLYQQYHGIPEGGNHTINISMTLAPPRDCSVRGYITDNTNGSAMASINVTAQSWQYLNSTQTNATGYYYMGFIPEEYQMGPDATGYERWIQNFNLNSGDHVWRNITLEPVNATIKGYVLSSGGPLDNAQVSITDPWGGTWGGIRYDAWTNSSGYYEINVTQGSKPVSFQAGGYLTTSRAVELKMGETSWLNVTLADTPTDDFTVKGYASDFNTTDSVSGVVYLNNANRSWYNQTGINATTGYYEISGPSGDLTLTAQSYWGHHTNSTSISPTPGDMIWMNISMTNDTDWTTIQGHVEFDSELITGASIYVYHGSNMWQTATDGMGDYSISVPSGYIELVCYYRPMNGTLGSEMHSTYMTTPANGNIWRNYTLDKISVDSIFTGAVEDSMSGLPIENVLIYMGNALPGMDGTFETGGMTDFKGEFEIACPSGQFSRMVLVEGYGLIVDTVDTSSAEWNWGNVTLDPITDMITVKGFVRDMDTGQPIIGLEPTGSQDGWMGWGSSGTNGYYEMNVPLGDVQLRFEPDSYGYYDPGSLAFYAEVGKDIWFNVSLRSKSLSITVHGEVKESGGAPVAGINVTAEIGSRKFMTVTDGTGQYSLQVPSGMISVRARGPGHGAKDIFYDWFSQEWESYQVDLTSDPTNITITNTITEWTYDEDGDSFYDWLYVNVTLNVSASGRYSLQGILMPTKYSSSDGGMGGSSSIEADNETTLDPGLRVIQLAFNGASIRNAEMDGYYVDLEIREENENWDLVDRYGYETSNHTWDEFEELDIVLMDTPFDYFPIDTDFDGLYNMLLFNVTVDVKASGNYSIFTMLNNMAPSRDDSELGMQMVTRELSVGVQTIGLSYSGTNIRNGGYHLGAMTIMLFNGSIDMESGNMQDYGICYIPMNYTLFQYYNIDSTVYGWVNESDGTTPIEGMVVKLYNITTKTMNATQTDASGYYELGGWEGSWILSINDDDDSNLYQGNLTQLDLVSGVDMEESRDLEFTAPDRMIRTITFYDWDHFRMEETIMIEGDNETLRFEMDADNMGNGDGFFSESEAESLMAFLGSQVQWPSDSNRSLLVDGIWYDIDGGSHTVDLGIVGSVTSDELVYIHQVANFTSSSIIPILANHQLDMNISYNNTDPGLFTDNNVTFEIYVQLSGAWGMTALVSPNVSVTGTNYLSIYPGDDPVPADGNTSEWIGITTSDSQPITTGELFGFANLTGNPDNSGVTIKVYDNATGTLIKTVVNTPSGEYQTYGLEAGSYDITATKEGYEQEVANDVAIVADETTWLNFTLVSKPPVITHTQAVFDMENNTGALPIYVQVSDDGSVGEVTLWVTDVHGVQTMTIMDPLDATTFSTTIPTQTMAGTVTYYFMANDTAGNSANTSATPNTIGVYELVPPTLNNLIITSDPTEYNDATNISIDIVDNYSPMVTVWINITTPSAVIQTNSFVGTGNFYVDATYLEIGTYNFEIWTNDSFGNVNFTSGTFVVEDTIAPAIFDQSAIPSPQEVGEGVNITANLTDLSDIDGAWVEIEDPDGTMVNNTMLVGAGDLYYFDADYTMIGTHNYTIWVRDNNGLTSSVSGNFIMEDTIPADIVSADTSPTTAELGETINFTTELDDISGIGMVYLVLENATAELWNVTLEGSATHYWYEFTILEIGSFDLTLWVEDIADNINSTIISLAVEDTTGPTFTGGVATPHTQEFGEDIRLSIDAEDASGIDAVCIYIQYPDDTFINVTADMTRAEYYHVLEIDSIGTYTYTFWIDDISGNTASFTGTFIGRDTVDPVANAGPSQDVMVRTAVTLDASLSSDNNEITNYSWSLNDNGLKRRYGEVATYTFDTPGSYEIALTVTDPSGNTDTSTTWVNVTAITGTGTITGAILDSDGNPIEGARVYVEDYPDIANTTDNRGVFVLDDVPTGAQTIVAGKDGFVRAVMDVTVLQDQSSSVGDMTLESTTTGEPDDGEGGSSGFFILIILLVVAVLVGYFLATRKKGDTPAPVEESETIIDEIFYMYNDGRLIKHFTRRLKPDMDEDILSSMLVAVQEFVKDSFGSEDGMLDEMKFGRFQAMMGRGEHIIIAAVIIGDETKPFKPQIAKCIKDIEEKYNDLLFEWDGDVSKLNGSYKYVMNLIDGQYAEEDKK